MSEQILELLVDIKNQVHGLHEKINLLSVSNRSVKIDDDDLIDAFLRELQDLQIDFELIPGTFNIDDVKNRAAYYFKSKSTIKSPRAYLSKVVSQIEVHPPRISLPGNEIPARRDSADPEIEVKLQYFDLITDDVLADLRFNNESIMWATNGIDKGRFKTYQKLMVINEAIKRGLICIETLSQ